MRTSPERGCWVLGRKVEEPVEAQRSEATGTVESGTETGSRPARAQAEETAVENAESDLGKVRELVLKAHPDVVPDLVRGDSREGLIASVEPARTAYQRIAEAMRGGERAGGGQRGGGGQPPVVPAGGAAQVSEPGDFTPTTKIARALAERKAR